MAGSFGGSAPVVKASTQRAANCRGTAPRRLPDSGRAAHGCARSLGRPRRHGPWTAAPRRPLSRARRPRRAFGSSIARPPRCRRSNSSTRRGSSTGDVRREDRRRWNARVRRAARQLERPRVSGRPAESQHELLDREVPGVRCLRQPISPEIDPQRKFERDRDPLPRVHGVTPTEAPLDGADRRPRKTDPIGEVGLGSAAPVTGKPHVRTEARELLPVAPSGFRPDLLPLELDHVGCMVVPGSCPALTGLESLGTTLARGPARSRRAWPAA